MARAAQKVAAAAATGLIAVGTISCGALALSFLRSGEPLRLSMLAVALSLFAISGLWACGWSLRKAAVSS